MSVRNKANPRRLAATDARIQFGELVDAVAERGDIVEVERADEFAIMVAPAETPQPQNRDFDAEAWLANLDRLHEQIRAHRASHPIIESTVDILRDLRDDR